MSWLPVLSAGIGLGGQMLGMFGQNDRNQTADLIAMRQMQLAEQAQKLNTAGTVDPFGNQMVYDPTRNVWVSLPTSTARALSEASDREQLQRLTSDQALRREALIDNADRRRTESSGADELLRALMSRLTGDYQKYSPDAVYGQLAAERRGMVDRAYDDIIAATGLQALRSNNLAQMDRLTSALAKSKADAYRDAMPSRWDVTQSVEAANQGDTDRLMGRYNTMASRASGFPDLPFTPDTGMNTLAATLANSRSSGAYGLSPAMTGLSSAGGLFQQHNPLDWTSLANRIGSTINGARDLFEDTSVRTGGTATTKKGMF